MTSCPRGRDTWRGDDGHGAIDDRTWFARGRWLRPEHSQQPGPRWSQGRLVDSRPGPVAGGAVQIDRASFVGLGARVIDHISIGHDTVIGAGALVLEDIAD